MNNLPINQAQVFILYKSNSRKYTEQNMSYNWSYLSCKVVMICSLHQHGICILFNLRNMGVRRKSPQTSSLKKYVENNYKRKWVINVVMWSFMVISFHALSICFLFRVLFVWKENCNRHYKRRCLVQILRLECCLEFLVCW